MRMLRIVAGLACIAAALVAFVVFGLDTFGHYAIRPSPALVAHLPNAAFGLALLCVGAWLLKQKDAL
ncbi:MAG: hypothetical protein ABJA62_11000 [Luteimonas sp.]